MVKWLCILFHQCNCNSERFSKLLSTQKVYLIWWKQVTCVLSLNTCLAYFHYISIKCILETNGRWAMSLHCEEEPAEMLIECSCLLLGNSQSFSAFSSNLLLWSVNVYYMWQYNNTVYESDTVFIAI